MSVQLVLSDLLCDLLMLSAVITTAYKPCQEEREAPLPLEKTDSKSCVAGESCVAL
jgi:hypothetical protein